MIEETYKIIDVIIRSFKKHRRNNDYINLATDGMALLEYLPGLITYSVEQEKEYRKFEAKMIDERDDTGKRYTSSYSETKAKATDYYAEWQKSKQFQELIYEMVNMSKVLARSVNKEFNSQ